MLKHFAANRVYVTTDGTMVRNGVVDVDSQSHRVANLFCLEEEMRHTEWLGGIILLCSERPSRLNGEGFDAFLTRINKKERTLKPTSLYAYHITAFNVSLMEFTSESRIISL